MGVFHLAVAHDDVMAVPGLATEGDGGIDMMAETALLHQHTVDGFTFENIKASEKYNSFEDVDVESMILKNVILNGIKK